MVVCVSATLEEKIQKEANAKSNENLKGCKNSHGGKIRGLVRVSIALICLYQQLGGNCIFRRCVVPANGEGSDE